MSITDELRKIAAKTECASGRCEKLYRGDLDHAADRIDERIEREYVKLPVDADGVPIRVGDYVETLIEAFKGERGRVECLTLTEDGWCVDGDAPSTVRHVQPDSWERIIGDALTVGWHNGNWNEVASADIHDRLVERCRRLAGEA